MPQITGTTKLLGVIGNPIGHSLSPIIHNAAIEQLGLDYRYLAFPVSSADLATVLDGFAAIGLVGCSVTIPHKQTIIPLLAEITPLAKAIGAVNTIWNTPEGWKGTNTDVAGFISPLVAMGRDWSKTTVAILGNGGAARAVVAGCHQLGCGAIDVFGRDAAKLAKFKSSWQDIKLPMNGNETPMPVTIQTHLWDELSTLINQDNLLLVNSTPIGMYPQIEDSPISAATIERIGANSLAYDLIYTPRPTRFLQLAKNAGMMTIDGTEMLVQQGAVAFELWLQQPAPIEIMRQTLIQYLSS
ncbi:shikimate dehydrogenase [Chamaesiphon sp. VAR_48_metabat_135_sub]|uniref:shikimate dehydrogenase n=1 Tax=Chamaesiphon sp. VAR_48_metabat_135_sub TaxID=2964699 RepID=UPI00286B3EFE|nr:shikimate dehydrogenase [Chamaesiphon sp. VAR_48_metabat_135_sub]